MLSVSSEITTMVYLDTENTSEMYIFGILSILFLRIISYIVKMRFEGIWEDFFFSKIFSFMIIDGTQNYAE